VKAGKKLRAGIPMSPSSPPVTSVHFQRTAWTSMPKARVSMEK